MSARTWRSGPLGQQLVTGDGSMGATVFPARGTPGYHVTAHDGCRVMAEGPIPTLEEAQALASEWLDRREAEAQRKDGTA